MAVGLGVSTAAQAEQVAQFADGVIVGSAFVKRLLEAPDEAAGRASVAELAAQLAEGVRAESPNQTRGSLGNKTLARKHRIYPPAMKSPLA